MKTTLVMTALILGGCISTGNPGLPEVSGLIVIQRPTQEVRDSCRNSEQFKGMSDFTYWFQSVDGCYLEKADFLICDADKPRACKKAICAIAGLDCPWENPVDFTRK